jgi:methionine-rich copper-binding protein CopC
VEIDVWPNPISSRFSLRFSQPVEGETSISLIDQSGKTVYHTEQNCSKGETQLEIDLQGVDLKSGLYYVKTINSGIQLAVIKVIKN